MLAPIQALMGFALLTASLTWVLSLYPVLSRHRAFAHRVSILTRSDGAMVHQLAHSDQTAATLLLSNLAAELTQIRSEVMDFPTSIYFHSPERDSSLAASLVKLDVLASSLRPYEGPLQQATALLQEGVAGVAEVLKKRGVGAHDSKEPKEILRAYSRMHRRTPMES